jgi:hypothetical protein
VPKTEDGTVTPEEMDDRDRGVAVDVQVLAPDQSGEFGTVSMPGPLGVGELGEGGEKLEPVKGVTVGGRGAELFKREEADIDGEIEALVNGPLVDIDADGVMENTLSLPVDPDTAGDEIVDVPALVAACDVWLVYVPFASELDGKVPVVGLTVVGVSDPELDVTCGINIVPLEPVLDSEYGPDDDEIMVFETEGTDVVGAVMEKELVLMLPPVGPADDEAKDIELPAAVRELLRMDELGLKVPMVPLLRELKAGELVVPPTGVALGLVSDTADTLLLDAGAVGTRLPELDEG